MDKYVINVIWSCKFDTYYENLVRAIIKIILSSRNSNRNIYIYILSFVVNYLVLEYLRVCIILANYLSLMTSLDMKSGYLLKGKLNGDRSLKSSSDA